MMTLSAIKAFMLDRKRATVQDVCVHFDSPASAVQPLLDLWMAKGRLRKLDLRGGCSKVGSSCSCSAPPMDVFEWIE